MARYYDKEDLKRRLEIEQIYDLLDSWGGEPEYSDRGLICQTVCHNPPGAGSRKLYYYENEGYGGIFVCYTGCPESSFDIFQLCIKVMKIQKGVEWELYDAMDYIASWFGFSGVSYVPEEDHELVDWDVLRRHTRNKTRLVSREAIKTYNLSILDNFLYPRIIPWEREGILESAIRNNRIGYLPGYEQITIPHFDIDGRLVGIRGRSLGEEEAERYGKYRPLKISRTLYNHPLSMNLYHLNKSKENMRKSRTAMVFESEKACLMYESIYGEENDISCACCGSSISSYQISLLQSLGVNEVIIAFDRDFEEIGDDVFKRLKARLIHLHNKYHNKMRITAIFDKHMILPLKASPIDAGREVFEKLLKERIIPV